MVLILQGLYCNGSDSTGFSVYFDCFDYVLFVKVLLLGDGWVS